MHTKSYSSHLKNLCPHWTSSLPVLSVLDSGKHHSTFDFARSTFRMSTYKKDTESVFLCLAHCIWRHVPYFHQCCCRWQDFIHLLVSNLLCVSPTFHLSTSLPTDTCFYFLEWVDNAAESAGGQLSPKHAEERDWRVTAGPSGLLHTGQVGVPPPIACEFPLAVLVIICLGYSYCDDVVASTVALIFISIMAFSIFCWRISVSWPTCFQRVQRDRHW